jgi:hypothetical protein
MNAMSVFPLPSRSPTPALSPLALHQFHNAIYDVCGWAVPDKALRSVVHHIPQSLWDAAARTPQTSPALPEVCQWVRLNPDMVREALMAARAELDLELAA